MTTAPIHKLWPDWKPGDYKTMESMKTDSENTGAMSDMDQDEFDRSKDGTEVEPVHVAVDTDDKGHTTDNGEV